MRARDETLREHVNVNPRLALNPKGTEFVLCSFAFSPTMSFAAAQAKTGG